MNIVSVVRIRKLLRDTRGANMVEYIIIVGLVAFLAIAGFTIFGQNITSKVGSQANTINNLPQ
jgi:pilus assembly protein Flp/PilA